MIWAVAAVALAAAAYQLLALAAVVWHLLRRESPSGWTPSVSILKPVRGLDTHFYEAIRSHAIQRYPGYEILFGVNRPDDPALGEIDRLKREFPALTIRVLVTSHSAPNGKVAVLMELAEASLSTVLVVNDSDIAVPPDYLRRVVAPLEQGHGLVTCLYRAVSGAWPGRWEALGISVDFAPSTLVAPLVGIREFGLGSTLAFRAEDLRRIGGFAAVADYIADDYQLAKRITGLGPGAAMSKVVVDTRLAWESWRAMWNHQLRWARTIRRARPGGYLGLPVTHAGLWAFVILMLGHCWLAAALAAVRLTMGIVSGVALLRSPIVAAGFLLIPLWDVFAFCVWIGGLFGDTVEWRGLRMRLGKDGKIID